MFPAIFHPPVLAVIYYHKIHNLSSITFCYPGYRLGKRGLFYPTLRQVTLLDFRGGHRRAHQSVGVQLETSWELVFIKGACSDFNPTKGLWWVVVPSSVPESQNFEKYSVIADIDVRFAKHVCAQVKAKMKVEVKLKKMNLFFNKDELIEARDNKTTANEFVTDFNPKNCGNSCASKFCSFVQS